MPLPEDPKESMEFLSLLGTVMDAVAMGIRFEDADGNPVSPAEAAIKASKDKNHGLIAIRD